MKSYKNTVLKGYNGCKLMIVMDDQQEELTLWHVMFALQKKMPVNNLEEAKQARLLLDTIAESRGKATLTIEESVYDWIKKYAETLCANLWRENAIEIIDTLIKGFMEPKQNDEKHTR
ncbi:MAG: hypothetical protein WC261_14805 [Synergistaceae bacterium]|jgi:hypothetical protein